MLGKLKNEGAQNIMKKKMFAIMAIFAMMICMSVGCGETEENQYTKELMNQAYDAVGFPDVSNYFERAQLKEICELRDDPNLICYWYTKNDMSGKWIYQGKCIGYGIPYTTSMTASESLQQIDTTAGHQWEIIPLAEPNGLYASPSTSATWILSVNEDGDITPIYVESEITVSQTKMAARLCEDWSLDESYQKMPEKAEIEGEVDYEKPDIETDQETEPETTE